MNCCITQADLPRQPVIVVLLFINHFWSLKKGQNGSSYTFNVGMYDSKSISGYSFCVKVVDVDFF